MKWYKVTLEMRSWTASAWQADTIFGHLCWAMRYLYGEDELVEFLNAYQDGSPPLLVSNGFPGDMLPMPVLPPSQVSTREEFRESKEAKKIKYLAPQEFARAISGEYPSRFMKGKGDRERFEIRRVTLKNQIDRATGTTGEEGRLFPFEEFYWWPAVSIYLKVDDEFVDRARSLFDYLATVGYGKRKSVGYGQVKQHTFKPFDGFPSPSQPNGFITLSNFVPSEKAPTTGHWSHLVKYGKLGEEYSLGEMVFKKPLLMLEAGSTFYDSPVRPFYGRMVPGISPAYPQVVQYGLALPVPVKLRPLEGATR